MIALLLALVIVAVLAQTALKRYGLLAGTSVPAKAASAPDAGEASRADPAAASVSAAPRGALERARGVEADMRRQADDLGKQIDEAAK